MRLYLSGPMTGLPGLNFPAFNAAAAALRKIGHDVWNPAEHEFEGSWADYLAADVKLIADGSFDGIVVLPGWETSRGACLETYIGHRLCGLEVYSYTPPGRFCATAMIWPVHALKLVGAHVTNHERQAA